MTFRESKKKVLIANQLSNKFAEPVTFTPVSTGTPRTVWMQIAAEQSRQEDTLSEDHDERVTCLILTDDSDADKGGVAQLFFQDQFFRSSTYDPDDRPFFWTGEITERHEHHQVAIFSRSQHIAQGPGN